MEYQQAAFHGVMFHHFHGEGHREGQGSISASDFEKILRFINPDRIVDPNDWMARLQKGTLTSDDICLTFDDGLLCQFDIALPILKKYRLKAFWFVYSTVFESGIGKFEIYRVFRSTCFDSIHHFYQHFFDCVFASPFSSRAKSVLTEDVIQYYRRTFPFYSLEDIHFRLIRDRALSRQDFESIMDTMIVEKKISVAELTKNLWMQNTHLVSLTEAGHHIGLHSYTHPTVLADLSYEEQCQEYIRNYDHIKRVCGKEPVAMAHPVNSYNDHTLKILKQLKIGCGFLSNMHLPKGNAKLNQRVYEVAREDHSNIMRMLENNSIAVV